MAKEELIELEGLVTEILPDARFRVQLDAGQTIIAYTAGKMKKNRIKTLAGDRVTVEMSPYDLEKGRLIFRHKDERASGSRPPQRHGPWHAVGVIRPDVDPPHRLPRAAIEKAIGDQGFQLWRMTEKTETETETEKKAAG